MAKGELHVGGLRQLSIDQRRYWGEMIEGAWLVEFYMFIATSLPFGRPDGHG